MVFALFMMYWGRKSRLSHLDENGSCIDAAFSEISGHGIQTTKIKRLSTSLTPFGYVTESKEINGANNAACSLVESDVCNDRYLKEYLLRDGKFDAITVWLVGTHMMRQFNATIAKQTWIQNDVGMRLFVQNSVYELADELLRPGGTLQIIDRGEVPSTDELRADFINAHKDQASVTSLNVADLSYLIYEEPEGNYMPMKVSSGTSGRTPDMSQRAFISVVSVKP